MFTEHRIDDFHVCSAKFMSLVRLMCKGQRNHHEKEHSIKRTCEVNTMDESSSLIFTCYVKTVPVYYFKLVWVVLHRSVKEFFERFSNKSKITMFYS